MRRTSYQKGSLRLADRKKGKVWEFLWREVQLDGSIRRKHIVIGTLEELWGFAVWNEDEPVLPIEILDAHPVEFTLISHSRIAHQDDNVTTRRTRIASRIRLK